jgi:hypothetical protein
VLACYRPLAVGKHFNKGIELLLLILLLLLLLLLLVLLAVVVIVFGPVIVG